ncbi:HNH endonuclease [Rhodococcus sp. ABRD24]|uniref:HNH endonuclease signature motif containing protein n=1 Tax=Rhodococcus sp. ABRD24 TaxID=2507582 RepID=UPI001040CB2E|nr:HNH endonuclease signature motif containing protein [Rhodococcus sp. ABRD24]QBJ95281.1 HNH endonuclease [Rhodococcus sp. ABRD24]
MTLGGENTVPVDGESYWRLTEQELLDETLSVCAEIARLQTRRVRLVGAVDSRCTTDVLGFRDVRQWLAATTLLEVSEAGRILNLARGLREEPDIREMFDACEISAAHTALVLTFCQKPPRGMPDEALWPARRVLLEAARGPATNTAYVHTQIHKLERIFESDDPPPSEETDRNELHVSKTLNGRYAVRGDLDAVTGDMLQSALSPLSAPHPGVDGTPDPRPPAQRRADALTELLRRYLDSAVSPTDGGTKPHLHLHINARDLADHSVFGHCSTNTGSSASKTRDTETDTSLLANLLGDTGVGRLPWAGPITVTTTRRLTCDCILSPIVMDEHAAPINLGRTMRTISAAQRRALIARDTGCAFPGCSTPPSWCDGHHIRHWADGGPTNLDNLVLLCRFHHNLLHHSHWHVRIGPTRHPEFIPPTSIDPRQQPLPANNRAGPTAA